MTYKLTTIYFHEKQVHSRIVYVNPFSEKKCTNHKHFCGFFFSVFIPRSPHSNNQYESPIFSNELLFTYFVSKYWQDKSFELRPKYIKKCQYNSLHAQKTNTLQHLKLGKLKFGIRKIGCSMS